MSEADLHRDLGRLEGKVGGLEDQIEAQNERLGEMQRKVDVVHDAIVSAKGGWKTLVIVGGIGAAIGTLATKVIGAVGALLK